MKVFMTVVMNKNDVKNAKSNGMDEDSTVTIIRLGKEVKNIYGILNQTYTLIQNEIPVQLRITNLPSRSSEFIKASEI